MKKKVLVCVLCFLAIIILVYGLKFIYDMKVYSDMTSSLSVSNPDISKIKDGIYIGEFNAKLVAAKTKITIKDGKIANIELLEHKNGRGKSAEVILQKVLSAQSLAVDTVSGATNSSNVILKSMENALKNP